MSKRIALFFPLMALLLSACGAEPESQTIRVAVLPVLDVLPLYVALQEGYFSENGIHIELVPVASAPERDQLMQVGEVDAMLNEIVSTLFYNQNETKVVMVRFARVATSEYPVFRILAAAGSGIETAEDLAGVPIGVSEGTIIEYTTDRILENAGLTPDQIAVIAVPKIPDRLALLASGELQAANLPDPVASLALQQGATLVIDDTSYPEISSSVISFSAKFIEENPAAVKAFLKAYEQAVAAINGDKIKWNDLLVAQNLLPPPLVGSYTLPDYPTAGVPSEAQFNDALNWALDKGLIASKPSYSEAVTAEYLP